MFLEAWSFDFNPEWLWGSGEPGIRRGCLVAAAVAYGMFSFWKFRETEPFDFSPGRHWRKDKLAFCRFFLRTTAAAVGADVLLLFWMFVGVQLFDFAFEWL
jgi:hypothetical protein